MPNFNTSDILVNPAHRTTMWKVLETAGDQVRLVRCGKDGAIHKLVKDKRGSWKPASDVNGYQVVAPQKKTAVKSKSTPAASTSVTRTSSDGAKKSPSSKPIFAPTNRGELDLFLRTMETFHTSTAQGYRNMARELQPTGKS